MASLAFIYDAIRQCFFIPAPTLTEKNLPSQIGRVFIITGGYSGCGKELAKLLYQASGVVYLAGRNPELGSAAITEIKQLFPSSDGRLEFLKLDLADLTTIQASAEEFLKREQRLDVLTNNAGVMGPPVGSKTAQGHELQMGTNCLGPFLFTQLLTPLLQKTAASSPAGSVRVTWAASLGTIGAPSGGVAFDADTGAAKVFNGPMSDYAQTKACNVLLAREYQARYGDAAGIVSNSWNPGNLTSPLQRYQGKIEGFATILLAFPVKFGGYTELFAGWSEEPAKKENRNKYIGPWGRFVKLRGDIDGNAEGARRFWEWCEKETKEYA